MRVPVSVSLATCERLRRAEPLRQIFLIWAAAEAAVQKCCAATLRDP